jgi:uncharacterized protein (DUF427 family)
MATVTLDPVKHIRIRLRGETIVDTTRGYVVHEGTLSDRYYVPREDVKVELKETADGATCPWKGKWHHVDVAGIANGAWTYYDTTPVCEPIKNYVAFYANKVDSIDVE